MVRLLLVVPLVPLLAACHGVPEACQGGAPSLEVGVGELVFIAAPPGTEVSPAWGGQGGWHVWTALAVTGLPTADDVVAHLVATAGGEEVAEALPYLSLGCDPASGRMEAAGIALQFFVGEPRDLAGLDVDVVANIALADGTSFEGATTWRIRAE